MVPLDSKSLKYLTKSDIETVNLGEKIGALLKPGDLVALVGHLGSGKTWLTKGLALGFGVDPDTVVTSPSFSLVNEYDGRQTLYHMDLYKNPLPSPAVEFTVEDLLPGPEIQPAVRDRNNHLPAHYLPLHMGIGIVFTHIMPVHGNRFMGRNLFKPDFVIMVQTVFIIIDKYRRGNMHGVYKHKTLFNTTLP